MGKYLKLTVLMAVLFSLFIFGFLRVSGREIQMDQAAVEEEPDSRTIFFAQKSNHSYTESILNESIKLASKEKGWNLEVAVADYDGVRQNNQIINYVAKHPDAILSTVADSRLAADALDIANTGSVPVCVIGGRMAGPRARLTVRFDEELCGAMAATQLVQTLVEKNQGEQGVVFIVYDEHNPEWEEQKKGVDSILKDYPDVTAITSSYIGAAPAVDGKLEELLEQYQTLDGILCFSELLNEQITENLEKRQLHLPREKEGHVIRIACGGTPQEAELLAQGFYDAVVSTDMVSWGKLTVDFVDRYLFAKEEIQEGEFSYPDVLWERYKVVKKGNSVEVRIPPYLMDRQNWKDSRNWWYIARKVWGFEN